MVGPSETRGKYRADPIKKRQKLLKIVTLERERISVPWKETSALSNAIAKNPEVGKHKP